MPRMSDQAFSVAANAVSVNVLSGLLHEFLDRPAELVLAAASSAVGIRSTLIIGGQVVLNDSFISQANRFPLIPDDIAAQEQGIGRMILTFRNTTGAALTVNWLLDVTYLT